MILVQIVNPSLYATKYTTIFMITTIVFLDCSVDSNSNYHTTLNQNQYHITVWLILPRIIFLSQGRIELQRTKTCMVVSLFIWLIFLYEKVYIQPLRVRFFHPLVNNWGRDKMAVIVQTIFSNVFSWIRMFAFRLKFLLLRVQLKHSNIGSDNGSAPTRRQATIWINDGSITDIYIHIRHSASIS